MLDGDALKVLHALERDPRRSVQEIGDAIGMARQTVWRIKKRLEEDRIVIGYGAVVDWARAGWREYYVAGRGPPLTAAAIAAMGERIRGLGSPLMERNPDVLLRSLAVTTGQGIDCIIHFVARNGLAAKGFLDYLETVLADMFDDHPIVVDVLVPVVSEGKNHYETTRPVQGLVDHLSSAARDNDGRVDA